MQAEIDRENFLKSELEQNKVDLKLSKEAEIKRVFLTRSIRKNH